MRRPQSNSPFLYVTIAVSLTALLYLVVSWLTRPSSDQPINPPADVSMTQLLSVPEVTDKALSAVVEDNPRILIDLQAELVSTAEQLGFTSSQLAFLDSEQLIVYLTYHAKRELFHIELQNAYLNLQGITELKAQYPEARDLFNDADQLIARRNQLIEQIALTLANQDGLSVPSESHFQQAVKLWREKMSSSISPSL